MTSPDVLIADKLIPMDEALDFLGHPHNGVGENLQCPVHSQGGEVHPSAKMYGPHDSIYCFACAKQYSVTEVAAALLGESRQKAAAKLLGHWKPTQEERDQALSEHGPKKEREPVGAHLLKRLEKTLRGYKRKIPLELYRGWAEKVDSFKTSLLDMDQIYQEMAVSAFCEKFYKECEDARANYRHP